EVHVVDSLATGKRENVPAEATLHERDIREPLEGLFAELAPEACFHLAAQADVRVSVERPDFDAEVNVIGTLRVLEGARASDTPIVFSSTGGAIYGECERPALEDDPRRPLAPYGTSKLAGEEYLATYNRLYGARHVSLRFGNVYGPRQDPHGEAGVVAIFAGRLLAGESCTIFGDGNQTRDFVYVDDVVDAFARAAQKGSGLLMNVGTGVETSVNELYATMARAAGSDRPAQYAPPRSGELARSSLDPTRAEIHLGWKSWTSMEDGAGEVLRWFASRTA
ncbi:MAG: NAD-dependent epimerase/dehydratase family protein, partial [Actinomycetota bacterium]|nr:NAD-dependent epimerase/dehydratase family protein [Actinomycetota bacterium]